jgi:hypothetical protein
VAVVIVMRYYNIYVCDLNTVGDEKIDAVFISAFHPFISGNFDILKHVM